MMKPDTLFTAADKERISEAVKNAERSTSGEIVPFVVGQSDTYAEARFRVGALFACITLCVLVIIHLASTIWVPYSVEEVAVYVILSFGLGIVLAGYIPQLKRLFISSSMMSQRVQERAAIAFLAEEVFNTRERTGILIFLSLFEHRVVVMGDSGINEKVEQKEWDSIVALITSAMKKGTPAEGLVQAIGKCGSLLENRGVEIREDDTNELDNALRMSDK